MSRLVNVTEAARVAGVSPDTIRRWCDAGRLPSLRTSGGHRRIDVELVEKLLADGPTTSVNLTRDTRDLAAVFEAWRYQVQDIRPFLERPFDTPGDLDSALKALRGRSERIVGGLLGELEGLVRELEEALYSSESRTPPRPQVRGLYGRDD